MRSDLSKWAATFLVLALAMPARATDPVQQLRHVLKTKTTGQYERDRATQTVIPELRNATSLLHALQLEEWQDLGADETIAFVDRCNRTRIIDQFERSVRAMFEDPDPTTRLAAVNLVAGMGVSVRDTGSDAGLARRFSQELVEQCGSDRLALQRAALRALGQTHPRPDLAVATLRQQQRHKNVDVRRAVAESLYQMMKLGTELSTRRRSSLGIEARPAEVVELGVTIVPVAVLGLDDPDEHVRKFSMAAVAQSATALRGLAVHLETDSDPKKLLPLYDALRGQGERLNMTLIDSARPVGVLARWTLEELAAAQNALVKENVIPNTGAPTWTRFKDGLETLTASLEDPDVRVRRSALDVLETLGPAAAAVAPAVVRALDDEDCFVRWAAARTLGKLGPEVANQAVPALVGMLADPDADLRLAALHALEQFGPRARSAVPALIGLANDANVDIRIAAFRTVERIGHDARAALPILTLALEDDNARVRCQAARSLGAIGPQATGSLKSLYRALNDTDADVRNAASQALIKIKSD
ncbi:MAG: HEAT repeat domain-containing protein [Gemmataceae bacterium]